jgi:hypothetical protein
VVGEGHRAECHYVAEAMTWAVDRLRDPGPATGGAR